MPVQPRPVLLDVDTGVDDAQAILLALHASAEIEVVGITTVSGNTSSHQAALNTRFLLEQFPSEISRGIPIVAGASRSLSGQMPQSVPHIHGEDGLGGVSQSYWTAHAVPETTTHQRASDFILQVAKRYGPHITIVATAPATNLALASISTDIKLLKYR